MLLLVPGGEERGVWLLDTAEVGEAQRMRFTCRKQRVKKKQKPLIMERCL